MQRTNAVMLAALLGLAGCSKSSSSPPSAKDFTETLVQALGDRFAACTEATPDMGRQYMLTSIQPDAIAEAQRAGRIGLDEAKARECLAWIETAQCAELMQEGGGSQCLSAFVPKVHEGGACTLFAEPWSSGRGGMTAECIQGECVLGSDFACVTHGMCRTLAAEGDACQVPMAFRNCAQGLVCGEGTCEAGTPVVIHDQVGDPCDFGQYHLCADALYCVAGDTAATCQPRVAQGGDCTGSDQCAIGTSCNGTCQAWKVVGADCTAGEYECVSGAFCDSTTSTCTAFPKAGGTCGSTTEGEYIGCVDSWCEYPDMTGVAAPVPLPTCQPYVAAGGACTPELDRSLATAGIRIWTGQCGPGMVCDPETSTCIAYYCGGIK